MCKMSSIYGYCLEQWRAFCTFTGIKCFVFLYQSHSWFERCLWLLTLIGTFSVTIFDVFTTVQTYQSGPTSTKLIMKHNSSVSLPEPKFCFTVKFDQNLNGINIANTSQIGDLLDSFGTTDVSDYLAQQMGVMWESIENDTDQSDNRTLVDIKFINLIYVTSLMLSNIMRVEMIHRPDVTTVDLPWGTSNYAQAIHLIPVDSDAGKSVQSVYNFYIKRGIPPHTLIDSIGAGICLLSRLLVETNRDEETLNYCRPNYISWFGTSAFAPYRYFEDWLCIKFPSRTFMFESSDDLVQMSLDSYILYSGPSRNFIYVILTPDRVYSAGMQNTLRMKPGIFSDVTVQLLGHYVSLSTNIDPCTYTPKLDCLLRCRYEYILDTCGCKPLFSHNFANETPYRWCSEGISDSPNIPGYDANVNCINLPRVNQSGSCESKCYRLCERKIFNYMIKERLVIEPRHSGITTEFRVTFDSFVYPLLVEYYSMDHRQFMAQLGGNLSLWIGASFVVLFHFWVCFVRVTSYILYTKIGTKTSENSKTHEWAKCDDIAFVETDNRVAPLDFRQNVAFE